MGNEEIMDGEQDQILETPVGPGALLKQAREEKNLSQADIAKQLKLSLQWIKDLEGDNYAYAPAPIYIRGHLRSYARLVNLSPDAVIAVSEEYLDGACEKPGNYEKKVSLQLSASSVVTSRTSRNRKTLRWVSVLAILMLVVVVALWWSGKRKHSMESAQTSLVAESTGTPIDLQQGSGTHKKQR